MFSTADRLAKRTPKEGIDRRTYISLLVDEYYETSNIEAKQQVTANLANFAYDPINWPFLKEWKAHEVFVEILNASFDPVLLNHAAAGCCNLCLDSQTAEYLVLGGTVRQIKTLVAKYRSNGDLLGHLLTTLIQLGREAVLLEDHFRKVLIALKSDSDKKISNLATVLLEDHEAVHKIA
uniref:Armadillo repeat-containing protein 7 n=1 Tax=Culex pipiens TaxID=7175 RepID=A0A8D8HJ52_CULPI